MGRDYEPGRIRWEVGVIYAPRKPVVKLNTGNFIRMSSRRLSLRVLCGERRIEWWNYSQNVRHRGRTLPSLPCTKACPPIIIGESEAKTPRGKLGFTPTPLSPAGWISCISPTIHVLPAANQPCHLREWHHVRYKSRMHALRFLHAWDGLRQCLVGELQKTLLLVWT